MVWLVVRSHKEAEARIWKKKPSRLQSASTSSGLYERVRRRVSKISLARRQRVDDTFNGHDRSKVLEL